LGNFIQRKLIIIQFYKVRIGPTFGRFSNTNNRVALPLALFSLGKKSATCARNASDETFVKDEKTENPLIRFSLKG
jgi:hypothetical protein